MENSPQTPASERQAKGLGWLNVLLGIWLIIAPFALRYDYALFYTARWNDIIVGLFVTFFALLRAVRGSRQPVWSWLNVLLGVWLILAPFVLGYTGYENAQWNNIIVGVIIAVLAWASARTPRPA